MRRAEADYKIPGTNYTIEKGVITIIPAHQIHHDSRYYYDPERFNPDRFTPEEMKKRHKCAFLPFGKKFTLSLKISLIFSNSR